MIFEMISLIKKGYLISDVSKKYKIKEAEIKKYIIAYNKITGEDITPCTAKYINKCDFNNGIKELKAIAKTDHLKNVNTRPYHPKTREILSYRSQKHLMSFRDIAEITGAKVGYVRWLYAREAKRDKARLASQQSTDDQC